MINSRKVKKTDEVSFEFFFWKKYAQTTLKINFLKSEKSIDCVTRGNNAHTKLMYGLSLRYKYYVIQF